MSILRVETLYSQGFEIEQGNGWSHWIDHYGRHHYSWMDPDGTWNDQNDPPVPWPPGDWPDQGDGNSGNDWHDEGDDWANDDDWWDQWWEDPWEDWSYEDDLIAIGGGVNIVACPRLESRTDKAPNRTRLILGIGEEVEVRIKNKCGATVFWEINGVGVLTSDPNDQSKVTFQAHWTPGELRITANLTGLCPDCGGPNSSVELVFQVIKPTGVFIEKINTPITNEIGMHEQYRVSAGFFANTYILPDNVNFYNVTFQEDNCAPSLVEGEYFLSPPVIPSINHIPALEVKASDMVHPNKGTLLPFPDKIEFKWKCRSDKDPALQGTYNYDIIQYFKDETANPNVWQPIDILYQYSTNLGGANSIYSVSKKSASNNSSSFVNFRIDDPTTSFQLDPLLNCH